MPSDADPYKSLNLAPGATWPEIRRAYLVLLRQHPPERDPAGFRLIRDAYERLESQFSGTGECPDAGALAPSAQGPRHLPRPTSVRHDAIAEAPERGSTPPPVTGHEIVAIIQRLRGAKVPGRDALQELQARLALSAGQDEEATRSALLEAARHFLQREPATARGLLDLAESTPVSHRPGEEESSISLMDGVHRQVRVAEAARTAGLPSALLEFLMNASDDPEVAQEQGRQVRGPLARALRVWEPHRQKVLAHPDLLNRWVSILHQQAVTEAQGVLPHRSVARVLRNARLRSHVGIGAVAIAAVVVWGLIHRQRPLSMSPIWFMVPTLAVAGVLISILVRRAEKHGVTRVARRYGLTDRQALAWSFLSTYESDLTTTNGCLWDVERWFPNPPQSRGIGS